MFDGDPAGHILSVESNQNVQSKQENMESKIWKCGAQTRSVFLLLECNAGLSVMLTSLLWLSFAAFSVFTDEQLCANNFEKVI